MPGMGSDSFSILCISALGSIRPHIQRVTEALSPWVKRPGRETHNPPSFTEIKNMWSCASTPPLFLNAIYMYYIRTSFPVFTRLHYTGFSWFDTGYSWFPCVCKQMLRWFPRFQVALHASHVALPTSIYQ